MDVYRITRLYKEVRKILLLDHDGVICLEDNWGSRSLKHEQVKMKPGTSAKDIPVNFRFDDFDLEAIDVLNDIIQATDCEIVVSSDWRFHGTLEEFGELYKAYGILKKPIDTTSQSLLFGSAAFYEKNRASEVDAWATFNLTEEDSWVSVDDLNLSPYLDQENFVRTSAYIGLKEEGIKEEIIQKLLK